MSLSKSRVFTIIFHVVCWILVALPSITFIPQHEQQDAILYFLRLSTPLVMCIIFYINFLWLVPRYYTQNKINVFIIVNVVVIILFAFITQRIGEIIHVKEAMEGFGRPFRPHHDHEIAQYSRILIILIRNFFPLIISAIVAILLRLAIKWQNAEKAIKDMESQKIEAELKNLRNQINPHFLLNTLNNIYALISFNQEKAQKAILSLSELLRQMLYGNQKNAVNLKDEVNFINNYIDLMRIRMSKNVNIQVNIDIPEDNNVFIAPYILISLIENAFKHGVSQTASCFIRVNIFSDGKKIECEIANSNFPKSDSDRSGHGIGLEQVAKRLELAYKDKYEWTRWVDKESNTYVSKIILYDTILCDN